MNIDKFIKKHKLIFLIILSGIIPILLLLTKCIVSYIRVGSIHSIDFLFGDASTQYISLFSYLKDVLDGDASLIYSFSKNLGGEMISTYAYYLASPFNLLIKFFDKSHISLFFVLLVFLKISLSGITMFIYLRNKVNKTDFKLLIFSTAYSLCAYSISYYFNIMWLDILYLAPLVLLGVDNLFKKDNGFLYTLFLALSIFSNFYIAYMLCIFLIIYFIYNYILNFSELKAKNMHKKIILKFILFSILAALMCSFILLPTISDIKNFSRYSMDNYNISSNIFKNFFSKLFIGTHSLNDPYSRNTPNIYFGILPLILSILYFFNKNISKRERILSLIVILFFVVSFLIKDINLFFHGGSLPNGYVFRFSFLFSLFMITLATINFYNMDVDKINIKKLRWFFIFYIVIALISCFQNDIEFGLVLLIINIIFCLGYFLSFYLDFKNRFEIIFLIFILEMIVNINIAFFLLPDLNIRMNLDNMDNFCNNYRIFSNNNYRMDSTSPITAFDNLMCDSKGISGSISTNNGNIYNFFRDIGFNANPLGIAYTEQIVMATLLGMKYEITWYPKDDLEHYKFIKDAYFNDLDMNNKSSTLTYSIYKLKNNLTIGYLINKDYKYNDDSPFEYQNNLIKNFSNTDKDIYNIFNMNEIDKFEYQVTVDDSSKLYLFLNTEPAYINEVIGRLYINNELVHIYRYASEGVISLNNKWKNQNITVKFIPENKNKLNSNLITMASLNEGNFIKAIRVLQQNQLNITSIDKNILEGNINCPDDKLLFLSIPYEKGFKAYVNNKEVKIYRGMDNFMKIKLKKGNNKIRLIYESQLLNLGKYISLISMIIFLGYFILQKKKY